MSNRNQGQQGRPDHGGNSGAPHGEAGAGLQERASQVGDQVREGYQAAKEKAVQGYEQAGQLVSQNPGSSLLIGFGLGFGLGVAITLLFRPEQESWYDRYVPDSLRDVPDRLRNLRMPDAIARHLPGH